MATTRLGLQPWLVPYVEQTMELWRSWKGYYPTITSTYRSWADQDKLYRNRLSNPYPVNAPGDSEHNYGLAWDSDVDPDDREDWIWLRKAVGWRVPDNDRVHSGLPGNLWRQLVAASGAALPGFKGLG